MLRTQQKGEGGGRRIRRVWLAAVVVAVVAASVGALWVLGDNRSVDERLAEIEAARAVPDTENAALIYNELLQDLRATSLSDSHPAVLDNGQLFYQRRTEPWRTDDGPELAAWIAEHQYLIAKLVAASKLDACRFPLSIDLTDHARYARLAPMRQWAFLLMFALNNDLAEGHIDAAVTKWRCIIQIGNHLRQQPILIDHVTANANTRWALESMTQFVATGDPSSKHLQEIAAIPLQLADDWKQHLKQIRLIDRLVIRKMKEPFSLWDRLRYPIYAYRMERAVRQVYPAEQEPPAEGNGRYYRQNIATARGLHILIALRRYRDETGHWPESLEEISSSLPETMLIDPLNGGSFVYHRTAEAFELYSKGKNKIDETVRRGSDHGDDWPIWPLRQPRPKPKPRAVDNEAEEMMNQLKEIYGDRFQKGKPDEANGV